MDDTRQVRALVGRINAAEQRMKVERFEIAEAERRLKALVRKPGIPIPTALFDGLLPEARDRVRPIIMDRTPVPYTGST